MLQARSGCLQHRMQGTAVNCFRMYTSNIDPSQTCIVLVVTNIIDNTFMDSSICMAAAHEAFFEHAQPEPSQSQLS